jgi:hypothetical protein
MSQNFINVHEFKNVHEFDTRLAEIPTLEDGDLSTEIIDRVYNTLEHENSKVMFRKILSDENDNNDSINQCNASLILRNIINKIHDKNEMINLLDEQLNDCYNLGQCPQGRTIRLVQILKIFY